MPVVHLTDDELEVLISRRVEQASYCTGVKPLVTFFLDRARYLIKQRTPEQVRRMIKQGGIA